MPQSSKKKLQPPLFWQKKNYNPPTLISRPPPPGNKRPLPNKFSCQKAVANDMDPIADDSMSLISKVMLTWEVEPDWHRWNIRIVQHLAQCRRLISSYWNCLQNRCYWSRLITIEWNNIIKHQRIDRIIQIHLMWLRHPGIKYFITGASFPRNRMQIWDFIVDLFFSCFPCTFTWQRG